MQIKVFWLHGEEFEKKIEEINEWAKKKDIKQITVAANDVVFIQYDETIDPEKETEATEVKSFIHADKWRQMTASDIISSIDIGLSVLKEKEGFSKEYHGQLLVLIEEIAKMLAREV